MGMVRIRNFEFLCQSMDIEPLVDRFRVFYQLHCSQGFYSFMQCFSAKKILLVPPKSFHEWKPKFFFIKSGVIPVKMTFRGAEDIQTETLNAPVTEIWHQDIKEISSIQLSERALVAAKMSLYWKADHHDNRCMWKTKLVSHEILFLYYVKPFVNGFLYADVALYIVAYKKEKGKMTTVQLGANAETWYRQIVKNFALPKDADLNAQPSANVGVGSESKKKKRGPVASTVSKKTDAPKADIPKEEKKKGTLPVSDSWSDYVVVSDSLEGLVPVAVKHPKAEPQDTASIPTSNPDNPIDLESSPEPLVRTKEVKRKKPEGEAAAQPTKKILKKKINKKGNLDAFSAKLSPEKPVPSVHTETSSAFNDDLPPSPPPPPRASIKELLEGTKTVEAEVKKTVEAEAEKTAEVEVETADAGVTKPMSRKWWRPRRALKRKNPMLRKKFLWTYSEKRASDIHAPVWKLKQGDTFSDWQVCRDWLQGAFPPAEIKFQEEQSHERTYHAYLEETASSTSTTHRIVHEWNSMHKEWDAFEASKKEIVAEKAKVAALRTKLEADQAKFKDEQKTEEWPAIGWKKKAEAEAAQLAEARKRWKEICEKDNNE
ncbi:hypothetical protein HanHA300_Chr06g0220221 [Helianthus annuus]|nr:hypothetical protein HanHA300_Chr06g0220221 [Helianthus annuus]